MMVSAMTEEFEVAELFGKPALFSDLRIAPETIPPGWHCYSVRGCDYDPEMPATVEPYVFINHAVSFLLREPLTFPESGFLSIEDNLNFLGETARLSDFEAG